MLDDRGDGGVAVRTRPGSTSFTRAADRQTLPMAAMPAFEQIHPGGPLDLGQAPDGSRLVFIAGDVRTARCTGGQGELPFYGRRGVRGARVADFHRGAEFLTLDYSDDTDASASASSFAAATAAGSPTPPTRSAGFAGASGAAMQRTGGSVVYRGQAVTLDALRAQLLRDPETIKDEGGDRFKGKVSNLGCFVVRRGHRVLAGHDAAPGVPELVMRRSTRRRRSRR